MQFFACVPRPSKVLARSLGQGAASTLVATLAVFARVVCIHQASGGLAEDQSASAYKLFLRTAGECHDVHPSHGQITLMREGTA
jgi:hypothetical protein